MSEENLTPNDQGGGEGAGHWSETLPEGMREMFAGHESFDAFKASMPTAPVVPEQYTFPEGEDVDSEVAGNWQKVAREIGLTQAQSDALVKFFPSVMERYGVRGEQEMVEQAEKSVGDFRAKVGEAKFAEMLGTGQRLVRHIDAKTEKGFSEFLKTTMLDRHPMMIQALGVIGQLISEDKLVGQSPEQAAPQSIAKSIWPGMS